MAVLAHIFSSFLASCMAVLTIVATQAMTGNELPGVLLLGYCLGWFGLFGLGAMLPMALRDAGRDALLRAFLAFGAGGAVAGGLIAALLLTHHLGGSAAAVKRDLSIPFTVPWVIGAVVMYFLRRVQTRPGAGR